MSTVIIGRLGEDAAADYLESLGWRILARNWRCRQGELDIVAAEPAEGRPETIVFVEVKLRTGMGYGDPLEAITAVKMRHLRRSCAAWLAVHKRRGPVRIDAIGITKVPGQVAVLRHLRGLS